MSTVPGPRPGAPFPRPGSPAEREPQREDERERRETAPARESPEWLPQPFDPERERQPVQEPAGVP